ncbi:phage D3 protein [Pseudomonas aeruginosa]|nr:phage D3 protein [Pseudomonas aeruginosa]
MAELAFIRTAQGLVPATEADRETVQKWKAGQVVHGKFTRMRNAKFHGKFFAMLDLAWEYWEPKGGWCRARRCAVSAGLPSTSRI